MSVKEMTKSRWLSEWIKQERELTGLSLRGLAAKITNLTQLDIDRGALWRAEHGAEMKQSGRAAVARYLEIEYGLRGKLEENLERLVRQRTSEQSTLTTQEERSAAIAWLSRAPVTEVFSVAEEFFFPRLKGKNFFKVDDSLHTRGACQPYNNSELLRCMAVGLRQLIRDAIASSGLTEDAALEAIAEATEVEQVLPELRRFMRGETNVLPDELIGYIAAGLRVLTGDPRFSANLIRAHNLEQSNGSHSIN